MEWIVIVIIVIDKTESNIELNKKQIDKMIYHRIKRYSF